MSRIQQAMTRALKATAADLKGIVKIGGLSNQDKYILHRASEICTALMDKPFSNRLATEMKSRATNAPQHATQPANNTQIQPQAPAEQGAAGDKPSSPYPNHGKPWTPNENAMVQNSITVATSLNKPDIDVHGLSKQLGRTPYSIASKAYQMGFRTEDWAKSYRILPRAKNC